MSADTTIDQTGKKSIEITHTGHDKDRFTVALTVAANGTRLPAYTILRKVKKTPAVKVSSNIVLTSSGSGFMNTYLMKDYIGRVILPYIRFVNPDGKEDYHHSLLVLEDFSAHKVLEVKEYCPQYNVLIYLILRWLHLV